MRYPGEAEELKKRLRNSLLNANGLPLLALEKVETIEAQDIVAILADLEAAEVRTEEAAAKERDRVVAIVRKLSDRVGVEETVAAIRAHPARTENAPVERCGVRYCWCDPTPPPPGPPNPPYAQVFRGRMLCWGCVNRYGAAHHCSRSIGRVCQCGECDPPVPPAAGVEMAKCAHCEASAIVFAACKRALDAYFALPSSDSAALHRDALTALNNLPFPPSLGLWLSPEEAVVVTEGIKCTPTCHGRCTCGAIKALAIMQRKAAQ